MIFFFFKFLENLDREKPILVIIHFEDVFNIGIILNESNHKYNYN